MPDTAMFLLVEDDENDVLLIQRAFNGAKLMNPLMVVRDGEQALQYLKGEGSYANRAEFPLPALVLLDLNMPGMDGFQVLQWIRAQETLRALRVVVLTASDAMRDVNRAYQLGANSFLVKPVDFERFVEVSQALAGFWVWMAKAPDTVRPRLVSPEDSSSPRPPSQRW
jgi:CheY-like chemotaxis protein